VARGRLLVAKESYSGTTKDGVPFNVSAGQTIREGHPYAVDAFVEPFDRDDFDIDEPVVEQATASPGESRRVMRRR
jgi:hypothetical protein